MAELLHDNKLDHLLGQQTKASTPRPVRCGPTTDNNPVIVWTGEMEDFIPVSVAGVTRPAMIMSPDFVLVWQTWIRDERTKKKYRQQQNIKEVERVKFKHRVSEFTQKYEAEHGDGSTARDMLDGYQTIANLEYAHHELSNSLEEFIQEVTEAQETNFFRNIRTMNRILTKNNIVTREDDNWPQLLREQVVSRLNTLYPDGEEGAPEEECGPYIDAIDEIEMADFEFSFAHKGTFQPVLGSEDAESSEESEFF